jgi:hypothetical protein
MSRQPFSDFLATKDEAIHVQLIAIDKAIVKALPGVDAAIKWKQYMYAFDSKIKASDITGYVKAALANSKSNS